MANQDYSLIKKPHQAQSWTEHQISELAQCMDPVTGPMHFMSNYFFIQHPVKGKIQYQPFEYQSRLLEVYHNHRFSIALLPRQSGKCVGGDINISVRNKHTGKIYELPAKLFHEYVRAQKQGTTLPDISDYEKQDLYTML